MAENDANDINEIQDKYVPFLKKLISFLEKTNKATPENLNRLKSIYSVFTTSPVKEQIEVFQSNKKKLEKWFNSSKKDKMADGGTSKDKRSLDIEDTDSSQGAFESNVSKKPKLSDSAENPTMSPATIAQIKMEKADKPKIVEPSRPLIVTNTVTAIKRNIPASAPALPGDGDKIVFTCASCQFQTYDEQEFMKHTRTDHRSDLSMWCKQCGKCFSNAGVLVAHIKERGCKMEEMIYRCGVKDCSFETTSGQTFVHHLRHCHKGSPFIFCVHCQKIFTLPHCLILHMQDDCPYKDKNRRNPGSDTAVNAVPVTQPTTPVVVSAPVKPQASSFPSKAPTIASVVSTTPTTPSAGVVHTPPSVTRGRGALMPTARGRGRSRGRGRGRPPSESSDSDDADDPLWKPEETTGVQTLRRSGRWAKKVNDVINIEPKQSNKGLSLSELNTKEMLRCPCCDFMAAFKSVLQDHYIAHHKVPNKNACLVCHLKFEATQGFLDHFEDHASGRLPNKVMEAKDTDEVLAVTPQDNSKICSNTDCEKTEKNIRSNSYSFDKESIKGVVKNLSEAKVVNPTSAQSQYVKIPYQAVIQDKNMKDSRLKKFEELKAPSDLVAMSKPDKIKCFFKCVLYNCSFTTHNSYEYLSHLDLEHSGKRLHCSFCLKDFLTASLLTDHLMINHSKRQYQCNNCFYRAYSKIHVQIHIKNFHSKDTNSEVLECDPIELPPNITVASEPNEVLDTTWPFVCAIGDCNFQTFDPKEFKVHNETSHRSVSVFFCHYCKVDFLSFKRLLNHYRLHGINTFQCNYCIHGSETKDEILLHLCNTHADYPLRAFMRGTAEDASSEAKLLPYSVCSEAEKANKKNNLDSQRPESPTSENDDKNRFDYESLIYEVVGETYYPKYLKSICTNLVCGISGCKEKFENMLTYIGHLKNCHTAENFPCSHCPDVSDTWEGFKNHLMCHGPDLYSCGLVTCDFYDWDKKAVTNHLKSHPKTAAKVVIVREPIEEMFDENDVKQIKSLPQSCPFKVGDEFFQCCFCEYKSSDKSVMKNHIYQELHYKRFCCSSCNEKFVSRKEIEEHYLEKHSKVEVKCSINPSHEIENIVKNILNKKDQYLYSSPKQCGNCNKNFKSLVQWQYHEVLCMQNFYQPFVCSHCKYNSHSLKILKFHVDEKHFPKPVEFFDVSSVAIEHEISNKIQQARLKFLKTFCNNVSTTDSALSVKFYVCSSCSFESNHKYNLKMHVEKEHKDSNAEINKVFRDVKPLELNSSQLDENSNDSIKASSESSNVKRYRCGFCIKKLPTLQELESHVESLHPVREEREYSYYYSPDPKVKLSPDDKELFECSYCKSGKENLFSLKKHSDLMHSESPFKVRGYVNRYHQKTTSSIIACGYCYQRLDGKSDLKRHTALYHPTLPQKSIGGFRTDQLPKGSLVESDDIPNKRMKLGPKVYVCSHCGAAFVKQEQVALHNKKTHARFKLEFTTINTLLTDVNFYKCEFCQFTAEKQYVDTHLEAKHKMRVTCNYCSKRFEFATRLREHHDIAHNGLPIKYSQETVGIKKETTPPVSKIISQVKQETRPTRSKKSEIQNSIKEDDLKNIYTYASASDGNLTKISVLTFSKLYNIFPKVVLKDVYEDDTMKNS
ncbi:uncharacterized protein LOC129963041 [Argiope bruennichi]|uniref:Zinc finger protein 425 like protein n=1 Tax=Argiope bruennichi TaxID=94029 RepID=A0A8T0EWH5_ARGBR|nr:uncharacterized protein LOC129963041 [Argiope bruennichi]KAF8782450.1 Zinc finger protein 425 like protein [Argiope bruennichi]